MTKHKTISLLFLLIVLCFFFYVSGHLTAKSNQAIVPLNITVLGKLIITDSENDTRAGTDPTLNVQLRLTPDLSNQIISASKSLRIRTNLSNWKLTAQRMNNANVSTNVDPSDVSLSFSVQTGSKANPDSGKLISPFDKATTLNQISTSSPTDLLVGTSKTSLDRDPTNKNNWFQLTSSYSVKPDFFYEVGEWDTTISYNLVSP